MINPEISGSSDNIERYKERIANFSREFEFGLFLYLFRKSLFWIALLFGAAIFCTFLYLRYAPQVYQAESVLQIKTTNTASKVLNVQSIYDDNEHEVQEAIELLRSPVFIDRVLESLPLQISYFSEGTFRDFELYVSSPFHVEIKDSSAHYIDKKFYVDFTNETAGHIHYSEGGKKIDIAFRTMEWTATPLGEMRITVLDYPGIKKVTSTGKPNALYFVVNNMDRLAQSIINGLSIKILNEAAQTISISFRDNNANKTSDVVNAIAEEFKNFDIERKRESSKRVLSFIKDQLDKDSIKLLSLELQMQPFKRDVKPSKNTTDLDVSRFNALDNEIATLDLQESILDELAKKLNGKTSFDSYSIMSLLAGSDFENTLYRQAEVLALLEKERETLLLEVTPENPNVKIKENDIAIQKKLILESVNSLKQKIALRKENLSHKSKDLESQFYNPPTEEIEFTRLQRLYSINEKYYNLLLEKKAEYQISDAGNVSEHVILQRALVPGAPVSPSRKLIYIAGVFVAALFSLVLVLLRYVVHNQINSLNEITKHTNASIAVLGIIPRYKKDVPVSQ